MPRRLSLDVGVSSSESGSHSSARIVTFFTRSALLKPAIASSSPRFTSARTSGCAASSASDRVSMPRSFAHTGATSPSSTTKADTKGRWSPMAHACATSGIIFSAASRFAGLMFFPPAVMMSSFLRSTIRR